MSAVRDRAFAGRSDALVIGAGPAGTSAAILLARSGWQVSIVEQHPFPRDKVCGGCIAAGNFGLLDELGIGDAVRRRAGEALTRLGWMRGATVVTADMPACLEGRDRFGRALGRDILDQLLLEQAAAAGVRILQPAKVRGISGRPGHFCCEVEARGPHDARKSPASRLTLTSSVIIDAHGSWEAAPGFQLDGPWQGQCRPPQRPADLFAFKARFAPSGLPVGLLPVVALSGGYGGIVVANDGCTTVALCLRRDRLRALRSHHHVGAAWAADAHLRNSCRGIRDALRGARQLGPWLTVGPLRPGMHWRAAPGVFPVGNAAGECHPLVGEGISVALQSSSMLADLLRARQDRLFEPRVLRATQESYRKAWRRAFLPRIRYAALFAQVAMRAPLSAGLERSSSRWPDVLTVAARLAGKARAAKHDLEIGR